MFVTDNLSRLLLNLPSAAVLAVKVSMAFNNLLAYNSLANVLQEAKEAVRTAENQKAKALAEAQAGASARLAKAEKDAAAVLQEALAKAAQQAQQQEAQVKQAAEAARQQVCTMLLLVECPQAVGVASMQC